MTTALVTDELLSIPETEDLPPIPERMRKVWAEIQTSRRMDARMRTALRLKIAGYPFRKAAEAVGYACHSPVVRAAARYGVSVAARQALIEQNNEIVGLAGDELRLRLLERPDDFSDRDLTVVYGVGVDKVAKLGGGEETSFLDRIDQLATRLEKGEGLTVSLRVAKDAEEKDSASEEPIDVTPSSSEWQ